MKYLLDTNILSELRKKERANQGLIRWFQKAPDHELYTSVLVIGEIRKGVETIRARDPAGAKHLDKWLKQIFRGYQNRILPIDQSIADIWGRLNVPLQAHYDLEVYEEKMQDDLEEEINVFCVG